jgi:Xaa-Pro dipeptidase
MDGQEPPYLVLSDISGEFGVRLEDCWHMSEQGPKLFSGLARSIDDPI